MTWHDDRTRLRHMLSHADEATRMAQGCTREELDSDRKLNLALVRLNAASRPYETADERR